MLVNINIVTLCGVTQHSVVDTCQYTVLNWQERLWPWHVSVCYLQANRAEKRYRQCQKYLCCCICHFWLVLICYVFSL